MNLEQKQQGGIINRKCLSAIIYFIVSFFSLTITDFEHYDHLRQCVHCCNQLKHRKECNTQDMDSIADSVVSRSRQK